ncbi:MAG: fused MFS/spermidine synthase [Nitrospinota bacterium]
MNRARFAGTFFYTFTIGLSAFLLFQIQPMAGKIMLPYFGGGASVWLTSIVFFQLLLLCGYSSSHFVANRLGPGKHLLYQAGITVLSLYFLSIQIRGDLFTSDALPPAFRILLILTASVGLPYFVLSTTSPVLQHWMARDEGIAHRNPYVQYAVSNAGSLAGLLSYPFYIEPNFVTGRQTAIWSGGYYLYIVFVFICMAIFAKRNILDSSPQTTDGETDGAQITSADRHDWIIQAAIPSAALMVVTHYLTLDVVNFPLLWVLPLSLYLVSFVIVFTFPGISKPGSLRTLLTLLPILLMMLATKSGLAFPLYLKIGTALLFLFAVCMFFHGDLERGKPEKKKLTHFYAYLALGGCLGSIFAGILAPLIFKSTFEFYLVIIASLYYIVLVNMQAGDKRFKTAFKTLILALAVYSYMVYEQGWTSETHYQSRSFYSTYRVVDRPEEEGKSKAVRELVAGTHIHGGQLLDGDGVPIPIIYYHEESGVGLAFSRIGGIRDVGAVGLGAGIIAAYGKENQRFDFFEIDQAVVDIARGHFDYLKKSAATVRTIVGDARLNLRKIPDNSYDLLVMDAFSSGSIPTHLLTVESVNELLRVLRDDGIILYHISNRYLDLAPVLNGNAEKLGLHIKRHVSPEYSYLHKYSATWVALAANRRAFDDLTANDPTWFTPSDEKIYWTDDFSNIWSVISFAGD